MSIIKQVLNRMDEICPEADINVVEGELIDSLLDNALTEYLLIANIHKIPNLKRVEYRPISVSGSGTGAGEDNTSNPDHPNYNPIFGGLPMPDAPKPPTSTTTPVPHVEDDNTIIAPADYLRLVSVRCGEWKRALYENDCIASTSLAWKMSSFPFHEPTPLKPMVAIMSMSTDRDVRFHVAPCNSGVCSLTYVYKLTAEELLTLVGSIKDSFFEAYIWYVAYMTLMTMGQADTATAALQHAQAYQVIPNGVTVAPSK